MNIADPKHRAFLAAAAKEQPIGTCDICKTENTHVFEGQNLGPDTSDAAPKNICLDCFLRMGQVAGIEGPPAPPPTFWPKFFRALISVQRVVFLITTLVTSGVFVVAGVFFAARNDGLMFVLCWLAAWTVQYLLHLLNVTWHRLQQHED